MNPMGLVLIGAGIFAMTGAAFNWDWFMNSRKARFISNILSRDGARLFYIIIGLGLLMLGVLFALGIINTSK
jgi:hypothetical protein